jgi:hypothetical protein
MGGRAGYIDGVLHYSSDTAGAGLWGTTSVTGGAAITVNGQLWFPMTSNTSSSTGSSTGNPAPLVDIPSTGPLELPNETFAVIAGTPIPVSGGQRRINGRPIDRIFRALNEDGSGSRVVMCSCGYPLFETANELTRVTAGATTIWENGASTHDDVASVTWYEGDEAQIQDPVFTAKNGATLQPAYRGQMIGVVDFTSLRDWNNQEPALTFFIQDSLGGTLFAAWGGTWNPDDKAEDIVLSGGDLVADNDGSGFGAGIQGSVRGTVPHTIGRYTFGVTHNSVNGGAGGGEGQGIAIAGPSSDLDHYMGSQAVQSFRWGCDGLVYINGVSAGAWSGPIADGETQVLFVNLTTRKVWGAVTSDPTTFYGSGSPPNEADIIAGVNGFDISTIIGPVYPALTLAADADQSTGIFDNDALLGAAIGEAGNVTQADIIVATGEMSKLSTANILVDPSVDDLEEGITITNGLSWVDYLKSTGSILNFDFWEYGENIHVKRVAFDSPTIDLDGIPANHRMKVDDEKGSTLTFDGAERSKAAVVNLNFLESSRQFQNSMVPARSEVPDSAEEINITSPLIMPATLASLRANIALFKTEMESQAHEQCLPPIADYMALLPADVVRFDSEGKTYTLKVKAWTLETDFSIRVEYNTLLSLSEDLVADAIDGIPQFAGGYAGEPTDPLYPQTPGGAGAQRLFPMNLMGN